MRICIVALALVMGLTLTTFAQEVTNQQNKTKIEELKARLERLAAEDADAEEVDLVLALLREDVKRLRDSVQLLRQMVSQGSNANSLVVKNSYAGDCACTRIYYPLAQHTANYASYPELDSIVNRLNNDPTLTLRLAGHADKRGNQDANKVLALKRAQNLKAYLIRKYQLSEVRITTEGFGSAVHIHELTDPYMYHLNRRVEIYLEKN